MAALMFRLRRSVSLVALLALMILRADSQRPSDTPFSPPAGVLVAGLRETATHRGPIPNLRITLDRGGPARATFWVHLDSAGQVLEVKDIRTDEYRVRQFDADDLIDAIRKVVYTPFLREGNPTEAWVQDEAELLSREDAGSQVDSARKVPAPFPDPLPPTNFSIHLSRSGCFGSCPSYSVTIQGDGTVRYKGSGSVSIEGEHAAHIKPEAARHLLERFRDANFFGLKSSYHAGVTDLPTYALELQVGTTRKSVSDYAGERVGMPAQVTQLEDAVDETADSARWVTASSETLNAMRDAGISAESKQASAVLGYAVMYGKAEAVRALRAAGVRTVQESTPDDIAARGGAQWSLLEEADLHNGNLKGREEVIAALLEDPAIRADKPGLQRALGKAAAQGELAVARMLIAAGADPQALFQSSYNRDAKPADQTYLMRAVESGVWSMIDDALARPHDIHAVDRDGRSAVAMVLWTSPQEEDIFPIVDKLIADGAVRNELDRALADACNHPEWRNGLIARGANPRVCAEKK